MCQAYAESHGIIFNCNKTVCMTFKAKSAKSTITPLLKLGGQYVKSVDQYNYLGLYWIVSSQMTKTLRDNCDINIVQQTSCEPPFPDVKMQLKTYFFVPFILPCMHRNYGVISGSHACRDCVWHIILDAGLYTTCPGERVLVTTSCHAFPHFWPQQTTSLASSQNMALTCVFFYLNRLCLIM